MKKTLIAAGIAAVVAAPAVMADTTVYGVMNMAVQSIDNGTNDQTEVESTGSRWGIKGSEDLGNGMAAIYQIESAVDNDSAQSVGGRNTFVGLKGGFGTVLLGNHDTPMKMSSGKADPFGDSIADYNAVIGSGSWEVRAANAIAYVSPTVNGFHAAVAAVAEEDAGSASTNNDGIGAISYTLVYSNGPLYLAAAQEKYDGSFADLAADHDADRFTAMYTIGDTTIAGVYEKVDADARATAYNATTNAASDRTFISVKHNMGNNVLKASYGEVDSDAAGYDSDFFALGVEHKFSKRTSVQAVYASVDNDTNATRTLGGSSVALDAPSAGKDADGMSLQIRHKF